jgi:anti-sigma-K factor RskA
MTPDDAAVHAIGCVTTGEAVGIEAQAVLDPDLASIIDRHRETVAGLDVLMAASAPLPRPEVWDRIAQSVD